MKGGPEKHFPIQDAHLFPLHVPLFDYPYIYKSVVALHGLGEL